MQAISKIDLTSINGELNDIHDRRITVIDDYPTETSENLVNSDGVARYIADLDAYIEEELNVKDLSLYNIFGERQDLQNTANTYVVMEPGNYKFPLVYGNGIKDGVDNPQSYISIGTTDPEKNATTGPFVNYLNRQITSSIIAADTGVSLGSMSAKLIWQTSKGLVTEVSVSTDGNGFIKFKIGEIPATNADALIAVCDSTGNVMWSWLIWAVPMNNPVSEVTITNFGNIDYTLTATAIGAIWNEARTTYSAPYFQKGRKDPICPTNPNNRTAPNSTDMTVYDINGNTYTFTNKGGNNAQRYGGVTSSIQNGIKNPDSPMVRVSRSGKTAYTWFLDTSEYVNLWNNSYYGALSDTTIHSYGGDDLSTVIKTIYDPCPVGYVIPVRNTFTGTTTTGSESVDSTGRTLNCEFIRQTGANPTPGIKFKTKGSDTYDWFIPKSYERTAYNDRKGISVGGTNQSTNIWLNCTRYNATTSVSATNTYICSRFRINMNLNGTSSGTNVAVDSIWPATTAYAADMAWVFGEKEI